MSTNEIKQDEIIRMAREAGFKVDHTGTPLIFPPDGMDTDVWVEIQRFASLVAANERENLQMVRAIALEEAAQLCMDYGREGFSAHVIARAIKGIK